MRWYPEPPPRGEYGVFVLILGCITGGRVHYQLLGLSPRPLFRGPYQFARVAER